jgi:hypothetical protein
MIAFIMTGASGVPIVFNRLRTLFNRLRKGWGGMAWRKCAYTWSKSVSMMYIYI